jgi:hypothetical protein
MDRCRWCRNTNPEELRRPVDDKLGYKRECSDRVACEKRADARLAEIFPALPPGRRLLGCAGEARLRGVA